MTLPYPSAPERELPEPAPRQPLHTRTITMQGFLRDDGLFDIDGELLDRKHYEWPSWEAGPQPPAQPVHGMRVRLTLDEAFGIRAVAAALPAIPFPECRATVPPLDGLVGQSVARGWRKAIDAALGGAAGCTHVRELLTTMGTVAYQTLSGQRMRVTFEAQPLPRLRLPTPTAPMPHWGQCVSWSLDGAVLGRIAPRGVKALRDKGPAGP